MLLHQNGLTRLEISGISPNEPCSDSAINCYNRSIGLFYRIKKRLAKVQLIV